MRTPRRGGAGNATGRLFGILALAVALAGSAGPAAAKSLNAAPNPSFEQGTGAPEGWALAAGGAWASASARTGLRSVSAQTSRPQRVCSSHPIPVDAEQSYRLDGWIRCLKGRARLGMEALDG